MIQTRTAESSPKGSRVTVPDQNCFRTKRLATECDAAASEVRLLCVKHGKEENHDRNDEKRLSYEEPVRQRPQRDDHGALDAESRRAEAVRDQVLPQQILHPF